MSSLLLKSCTPLRNFIRFGHRLRGKPPGVAKTLSQRLAEENVEDPEISAVHDIGFAHPRPSRSTEYRQRLDHLKRQRKNPNLEKLARARKFEIDLVDTKSEWLKTAGPIHIRKIAEHYGVFRDLFGKYAYFTPRIQLDVKFATDDYESPVYHGNRLKPADTKAAPEVKFDGEKSLWTLVLTNPDGNLSQDQSECVHWMVSNIPGGDVAKGETIVPYLQPFPPKGTGYHRFIFVLYRHEKPLKLDDLKVIEPKNLAKRNFNTFEFYRSRQDDITPAGLAFFQADWDETLTDFFHNELKMKEPTYDYDYPEAYLNEPKDFPHRQPFNIYLDRLADPKEVNKRFLKEKLDNTHPFEGPPPPLQFPNAHFHGNEPSWLKTEIMKKRLRWGRINDVEK